MLQLTRGLNQSLLHHLENLCPQVDLEYFVIQYIIVVGIGAVVSPKLCRGYEQLLELTMSYDLFSPADVAVAESERNNITIGMSRHIY